MSTVNIEQSMTRRWRGLMSVVVCTLVLVVLTLPVQAEVRYIHTDALGSVVAVTDEQGNVIERREYEPYGAQLTPAMKDGPGYTGHVQDAVTGMVYMQQRYYDPGIGRFLSVDPVAANSGPGFNRYSYANNNPYKFTDPDGRQSTSISRAMDRDVKAYAEGRITKEEYLQRAKARGIGGVVGAAGAVIIVTAPETIPVIVKAASKIKPKEAARAACLVLSMCKTDPTIPRDTIKPEPKREPTIRVVKDIRAKAERRESSRSKEKDKGKQEPPPPPPPPKKNLMRGF